MLEVLSFSTFMSISSLDVEISDNDDVNRSLWQPRTPPLTLLRLLGIHDDEPLHRRPPLPGSRLSSGLKPPKNVGKNNRSSTSSSSSFFAGFLRPEVGGRRLPKVGLRQKNGNNARRGSLRGQSDDTVNRKPEVNVNDGSRSPHLQITPGSKQRWLSGDRNVTMPSTAAVDDVTDKANTGNTTEGRHDTDLSTISKASLSITPPTSLSNNNNITAVPEVVSTASDSVMQSEDSYDYDGQSEEWSSDNDTQDTDPFHAVRREHLPVWPVPQHHLTLYPPGQRRHFGPPSFARFPGHRPMYGLVQGPTGRGAADQAVDLQSLNVQSSAGWNGINGPASDTTDPPVLSPVNQAAADVRTWPKKDLEMEENVDGDPKLQKSGLNVEEDRTTSTSTSQSSGDEASDTALITKNNADDRPRNRLTVSTTSLAGVKSTVSGSRPTARGSSSLWGSASWRRSAGVTASPTSFHLVGRLCVCVCSSERAGEVFILPSGVTYCWRPLDKLHKRPHTLF